MTWIIIILVIAVVLGPIMHLVPSAKDKRLTALRAAARRCGLTVKITTAPKLDPTAAERVTAGGKTLEPYWSCTAYQIPMAQNLVGVGEFLLLKETLIKPLRTLIRGFPQIFLWEKEELSMGYSEKIALPFSQTPYPQTESEVP